MDTFYKLFCMVLAVAVIVSPQFFACYALVFWAGFGAWNVLLGYFGVQFAVLFMMGIHAIVENEDKNLSERWKLK